MPNPKRDILRWQQRKGATDTRLAIMLASVTAQLTAAHNAYYDRIEKMFSCADYDRLYDAWEAGQDAPADLAAIMDADAEINRLGRVVNTFLWTLDCVQRGGIISEHYVYAQTGGKMRGPNGEK